MYAASRKKLSPSSLCALLSAASSLQSLPLSPQPPHQDPASEKLDDAVQTESQEGHTPGMNARPQRNPGLYQVPQQTGNNQNKSRSAKGIQFKRQGWFLLPSRNVV